MLTGFQIQKKKKMLPRSIFQCFLKHKTFINSPFNATENSFPLIACHWLYFRFRTLDISPTSFQIKKNAPRCRTATKIIEVYFRMGNINRVLILPFYAAENPLPLNGVLTMIHQCQVRQFPNLSSPENIHKNFSICIRSSADILWV